MRDSDSVRTEEQADLLAIAPHIEAWKLNGEDWVVPADSLTPSQLALFEQITSEMMLGEALKLAPVIVLP